MSEGFTDLRLNQQEGQVQEGFWPSFTDIMTVVVMIFMIAMVVLLVRNMELVNQLRSTMEAERIAAELARETGEEKDTLSHALSRAEERIQQMQLQLLRLTDTSEKQQQALGEKARQLTSMTGERDTLSQRLAKASLQLQRLEAALANKTAQLRTSEQTLEDRDNELAASRRTVMSLEDNLSTLRGSLRTAEDEADRLQATLAEQLQEFEREKMRTQDVEKKYMVLVGDYDDLKVKYDKLVRPARSATGRHLVEVRYWKEDGKYRITWREGREEPYQEIKRRQLDNVLTRLDKEQKNGLYIKVIFPENSGLSYNEAWEFTNHLHRNYDYYFKE